MADFQNSFCPAAPFGLRFQPWGRAKESLVYEFLDRYLDAMPINHASLCQVLSKLIPTVVDHAKLREGPEVTREGLILLDQVNVVHEVAAHTKGELRCIQNEEVNLG